MEDYARTALVDMLTSTVTDPALGAALARVGERQVVLDSLIEGLGPLVSTLLQVTLGMGGGAAAGTMSLGQAEEQVRTRGRDLLRDVMQVVVDAATAGQERVPGARDPTVCDAPGSRTATPAPW